MVVPMRIVHATRDQLDELFAIESAGFPPSEGASRKALQSRLAVAPELFWLLYDGDVLVGFVDALAWDRRDLDDALYSDVTLHRKDGAWVMVLGVNTIAKYRHKGCGSLLMGQVVADCKSQGRKGIVLTCKEALVSFYQGVGFLDEGISDSTHGGVVWHQMRVTF